MIAPSDCDKVLLVQAELDGELDAAAAAALAAHRADCPVCQAAAAELTRARALIAGERDGLYHAMPEDLRRRIVAQLNHAPSPTLPRMRGREDRRQASIGWGLSWHRWWSGAAGFGVGAACAAALAFLMIAPRAPDLAQQIVAGHIRALQPGHLEDVASSDQHTVKPWFDGRIDFAPPVKDLATERFPLRGGRLDYLGGRPVAALVYQRDKHLIDLYVWPAAGDSEQSPTAARQQGYNVVHWSEGGMTLWAVSDLEAAQLREFAEDWRRSP